MNRALSRAIAPAALLFAATLTLTGCFSPAPAPSVDTPAAPTVDPATGPVISGTGYSFNAPEGWDFPEGGVPGFDPDSLALDLDDTDGFSDNINVILSPAGAISSDIVETAGVTELEGAGASDVEVRPRISVAGAESAHLSALFTSGGATYQVDQYYPTQGNQTYVVTFSFSTTVSQSDREAISESVLASWTWS